jgi:serine/threonine-protein kinase
VLDGRYRLDARIAAGGMGEVWRGTDLALSRAVAVKLLHPEHASRPDGLARFRAEAQHAGSLSHPNIAQVYDYCEPVPPDPAYLVLELVDGPSLARYLDDGPLSPARTLDVIEQAASGLAAAHRSGLLHRDIKPGNILLSDDGLIKITDFGIARAAGSAVHTRTGALAGTPAYLAPERFGGAPATPATDLYALGVVAHHCLTGQVPFGGDPLVVALAHVERDMPPLPGSVPDDLAALVADLTRKDPQARPASAIAVLARAGLVRASVPGPADTPTGASSAARNGAGPTPAAGHPAQHTAAWDTPAWDAAAINNPPGHTAAWDTAAADAPARDSAAWEDSGWDDADSDSAGWGAAAASRADPAGISSTKTSPAGIGATRTSLTGASPAGTSAANGSGAGRTAARHGAAGAGGLRSIGPGRRWHLPHRAVLVLAGAAAAGLASAVIWLLTSGPGTGPAGHRPPSQAPAAQQASPRHSPGPHQVAAAQRGRAGQRGHGAHTGAGRRRQHGHGRGSTQPSPTAAPSSPSTAPTPTQPAASPTASAPAPTPSATVSGNAGAPTARLALDNPAAR